MERDQKLKNIGSPVVPAVILEQTGEDGKVKVDSEQVGFDGRAEP